MNWPWTTIKIKDDEHDHTWSKWMVVFVSDILRSRDQAMLSMWAKTMERVQE